MAVDGGEIVKWVGEAVAATLVGGVGSWLTTARSLRGTVEAQALAIAALREHVEELEERLKTVEGEGQHAREQSSADHANAANLASRVLEIQVRGDATHATMQRILGLLEGRGIKRGSQP